MRDRAEYQVTMEVFNEMTRRMRDLQAFEEMMQTGFIEGVHSTCFGNLTNLQQVFVERRLIDASVPYL